MTRSYIGIGSNLGDREATLRSAVASLAASPGVDVVGVSTFRETEPVGPVVDQPPFLNGAVALETTLEARELLELLLQIEADHGRTREGPQGGPRTLDLDLLLHGDERIDEAGLTIPHPRLRERAFVLEPLADLGWTVEGED
jgi:2-amino-4-hydroxy-6-hydroxymethyldihydropteridine diphosphokinase